LDEEKKKENYCAEEKTEVKRSDFCKRISREIIQDRDESLADKNCDDDKKHRRYEHEKKETEEIRAGSFSESSHGKFWSFLIESREDSSGKECVENNVKNS
jgi:hypothetical protein